MRIALCEDSMEDASRVMKLLADHAVTHYQNGDQLWFQYQDNANPYDLIIFDIEMHGALNGLDVAAKIRRSGDDVAMILLTSYAEYAIKGYDIHPHCYLLKPVQAEVLVEKIMEIEMALQKQTQSGFMFHVKAGLVKIPFSSVLYMESDMHYTNIHTSDRPRPYRFQRKLADVHKQGDIRFVVPHKSYVVNADHIKEIRNRFTEIWLVGEAVIPISRHKKKSFLQALAEYDTRYCD